MRYRSRRRRERAITPKGVTLNENVVAFLNRINENSFFEFLGAIRSATRRGHDRLVVDFQGANRAYPAPMLGIIAFCERLRRDGCRVDVALPRDESLHALFLNCNWAHFLEPETYTRHEGRLEHHLKTTQFRDLPRQVEAVDDILKVVAGTMEMRRETLQGLEWSINEVTDNVLTHAECESGGLVQVSTFKNEGMLRFAVADSGRGILESLRQGYPHLKDDIQAVGEAVKVGVTRGTGLGNGLAGTLQVSTLSGGSFQIISGQGHLLVYEGESHPLRREKSQSFPGTLVSGAISTQKAFSIAEALRFKGVSSPIYDVIDVLLNPKWVA